MASHETQREGIAASAGAANAWSPDVMIERLGGDDDLARQLVALFLSEYPALLGGLRDSLASGNPEAVRRAAHATKGCLGNFVDGGPQATAYEIERLGSAGCLEGVAPLLARLEREVAALAVAMREFKQGASCTS